MRLLQPDPAARGHYLIGVRPDTLGATLRAVGTPDFVGAVTEFVNDSIDADAVHLERWRADTGSTSGFVVEWIGSGSLRFAADTLRVMDVYYQDYCRSIRWSRRCARPARCWCSATWKGSRTANSAAGSSTNPASSRNACSCTATRTCNTHSGWRAPSAGPRSRWTSCSTSGRWSTCCSRCSSCIAHLRGAARGVGDGGTASQAGFDARLERQDVQLSRRELRSAG